MGQLPPHRISRKWAASQLILSCRNVSSTFELCPWRSTISCPWVARLKKIKPAVQSRPVLLAFFCIRTRTCWSHSKTYIGEQLLCKSDTRFRSIFLNIHWFRSVDVQCCRGFETRSTDVARTLLGYSGPNWSISISVGLRFYLHSDLKYDGAIPFPPPSFYCLT